MRKALTMLAVPALLVVTSGCAAHDAGAAQGLPLAGPWDSVKFAMKSWGRPVTTWSVGPQGGGSWGKTETVQGGQFGDYITTWHDLPEDPQAQAALLAILSDLPFPAPNSQDCDIFMTDMPYGTLRLTRGETTVELAYNAGCMDAPYVAFLDRLKRADSLVAARGQAAPVSYRVQADGTYLTEPQERP